MPETSFDTAAAAAEYAAAEQGVVTHLPEHSTCGGRRTYPERWRVTTLGPITPSRTDGFIEVPMWARDAYLGLVVDERNGGRVTRVERTGDRVAVDMPLGCCDFPAETGILTRTLRTEPLCTYHDGYGECGEPAPVLMLFPAGYGGDESVAASCRDHALHETPVESVETSDLPVRCTGCGQRVWLAHPADHTVGPASACYYCQQHPAEARTDREHAPCSCPVYAAERLWLDGAR